MIDSDIPPEVINAALFCEDWMKRHDVFELGGICLREQSRKLRGIVARNALQRLAGEEAKQMFVTAEDIKDSLDVLYEWQQQTAV